VVAVLLKSASLKDTVAVVASVLTIELSQYLRANSLYQLKRRKFRADIENESSPWNKH
jgi:hypothetical protein